MTWHHVASPGRFYDTSGFDHVSSPVTFFGTVIYRHGRTGRNVIYCIQFGVVLGYVERMKKGPDKGCGMCRRPEGHTMISVDTTYCISIFGSVLAQYHSHFLRL